MSETFKPGDVVELKSGSPALTIIGVHSTTVDVQYYNYERSSFVIESILLSAIQKVGDDDLKEQKKTQRNGSFLPMSGKNPPSKNTY